MERMLVDCLQGSISWEPRMTPSHTDSQIADSQFGLPMLDTDFLWPFSPRYQHTGAQKSGPDKGSGITDTHVPSC